MSPPAAFDPYAAEARAEWRNRLAAWRAAPGETAFHATAVAAALLLAGWALWSARAGIIGAVQHLLDRPGIAAVGWFGYVAGDQFFLRRSQQQRWASDWLAAQPITAPQRSRRRRLEALRRLLPGLVMALLLLAALGHVTALLPTLLLAVAAAFAGQWLADRWRDSAALVVRRDSMLQATGRGSLWRWQWIVAGRTLAPAGLAPLLPVILLVPRGPALMLAVALALVTVLATGSAFLRMVALIVDAQRWLDVQPLRPRDWLPQALLLPLALLAAGLLFAGGALWLGGASPLPMLGLPLLAGLALLHVGATLAERRRPRRIVMLSMVHQLLLVAGLQAAPPLVPVLWALQLGWLLRRGLHA